MIATTASLLCLLAIALAAAALGQPLARTWPMAREGSWSQLAWRLCVGLVVAGALLMVLAFAGLLHPFAIQLATGIAALTGAAMLTTEARCREVQQRLAMLQGVTTADGCLIGADDRPRRLSRFSLLNAMLLAAALGSLLVALSPAVDGDALCYHLALPKVYLQEGGFVALPYHDNSTFPLLVEMLFLWALALEGAVTAQLVHWLFGLLLAAATFELARDLLGKRWAWVAATIAVLTPAVTNQMGAAFNDLALAVFSTYALVAWRRAESLANVGGEGTAPPSFVWNAASAFVPAGLMIGAALSTKYVALLYVTAVAVALLGRLIVARRWSSIHWRGVLVAGTVAASVAGPWYLRTAMERGNPLYPFLGDTFGTAGPPTNRASKRPLATSAADVLTAPWQVTMQPERFGGRGNQLGALFLAALPGVLLLGRQRQFWLLLGIASLYLALWFGLRQNVRFLLPIVPLLAVLVAAVWRECHRWGGLPARAVSAVCLAALALNTAQAVGRAKGSLAVVFGGETREDYLRQHDPSFAAAQFAATSLPANAVILSQDYRLFYFPCRVTRENVYRRETNYPEQFAGSSLDGCLRTAGFTHLLLMDAQDSGVRHSTKLGKLLADAEQDAATDAFRTLLEYDHVQASGERRHYRLVELPAASRRLR